MALTDTAIRFLLTAQDNTGAGVASASGGLDKLQKSAVSLNGVLGRLGVGLSIAGLAREFIQVNAAAESMQRALTLVTGSSEAAGKEMEFIRGEANRLGIEVGVAANSYVQLAASAKGTALEGQATREVWSSVANAMAALGKSGADTEGALLAISQMMSKGTVSAEELRGQLGERLPGAFQAAAKALGTTTQGLDDMLKKGEVVAADFLPKFAAELNKTFGDGQIDGFAANLNRLKNTFSEILTSFGETGAFQAVGEGLKYITVATVTAWEAFEFLGKTLANIGYTIANLDFGGYQQRQQEALAAARADVEKVMSRLLGVGDAAAKAGDKGAKAGNDIAQAFRASGVTAEQAADAYARMAATLTAAAKTAEVEKNVASQRISLAIEEQKTIYEVAKARGDETAARAAKIRIAELEIKQAEANAKAAIEEAKITLRAAEAKLLEAQARGKNVEAAQGEVNAAKLRLESSELGLKIVEEQSRRTRQLADATNSLSTSNVSAAVSFGHMADAAWVAKDAVQALAEMEQRLADIRDRANAARQQGGSADWEYLLGARGIKLSAEEMDRFKQSIESIYEYLRGTFDGKVVDSNYLLTEAIRRATELARTPVGEGGGTPTSTTSTNTTTSRTTTTEGTSRNTGGVALNITVNGPADAEGLARLLIPHINKIGRLRS